MVYSQQNPNRIQSSSVRSNRIHKNIEILKKFRFRFDSVSEKSSRVSLYVLKQNKTTLSPYFGRREKNYEQRKNSYAQFQLNFIFVAIFGLFWSEKYFFSLYVGLFR
jgi:hypothetical protein